MSDTGQPPGHSSWAAEVGDGPNHHGVGVKKSWAEMLGSTLSPGLNKNVLEIVLDKDQRGAFAVTDHDCAKVMRKIGLDPRPGVHVEAVQICPNGRGIILITLKPEIAIANFCRHDVFEVTASGIRVVNIKPAGKRDAVVTIKGLHPNTRDDGVLAYLNKFAKSITNKVIHGVYVDGPLKGLKNGDRSYKLEIKPNDNIGTYHVIDGQKVTLRYPGQQQTCARCHETARTCKGGGMARRCEAAGGVKVELSDYIIQLWNKIGYVPGDVGLAAVYDDHGEEEQAVTEQEGWKFTPVKQAPLPGSFGGVSIRQFPRETDSGEIMEFLVRSGLPEQLKENVVVKQNGTVIISNLENTVCLVLIENIHAKKSFGRKLYCDGIIPLTPEKLDTQGNSTPPVSSNPNSTDLSSPSVTASPNTAPVSLGTPDCLNAAQVSLVFSSPGHSKPIMSPALSDVSSMLNDDFNIRLADDDLVRRHSLSLRSPPAGSLASDILKVSLDTIIPPLESSKHLLASLKDLSEQLSDFGSARESLTSSSDEDSCGSTSSNKGVKKKRKHSSTPPSREYFLKKANIEH